MPASSFQDKLQPVSKLLKRLVSTQPKEEKHTVGVDLGATSLKCVALGSDRGGKNRPILGKVCVPLGSAKEEELVGLVKHALGTFDFPVRSVRLGISGQSVIMRVIEMPAMDPRELKQALPFEAQRYLPFPIQEVTLDGQALGSAGSKKDWVLVVACKKNLIQKKLGLFEKLGVDVSLVDVDALAMTNSFFYNRKVDPKGSVALIDVGGQLTNVVICRGSIPYLVRDIPWGTNRLLREVSQQTKMTQDGVVQAFQGDGVDNALAQALKSVVESLVVELQLSFDYFENQFGRPPEEVYASGGISQSRAFLDAAAQHMTQKLSAWSPEEQLDPSYAVAYGLALRGA